ncbi:hypothetical protein ACHAWC_009154, partial [Mediolabrus comicus]
QVISIRTTTSTTSTTTPDTITLDDKAKNVLKKSRQSAYNLLKHVRQNEVIPPKKKQKRKKKGRKSGGGIPDMLTITKAKDMFILSDEDLEHLHYSERPNPKSQFFSNMKLYDINDVLEVAREKYGDANGFLNFALAAKRKTTAAPKIVGSTNSQTSTTQDNNNVPAYVVAETWDIERFHFLMQFTLFPVIRNEKLAFQLWVERFPNVNTAKEFPFLPTCMKDDVDNTMERFVGRKDGGGFGYSILPNLSVLWDVEQLQLQDEKARRRAETFINRGIPNTKECQLLAKLLKNHNTQLKSFPFLFLYEWNPSTKIGQGDAVFANGKGGLAVVEAKAKTSTAHVTKQSLFYRQRLAEEYPQSSVSAAILTNGGFDWTRKEREDAIRPTHISTISASVESGTDETLLGKEEPTKEEVDSNHISDDVCKDTLDKSALLAPSRMDQLESMVVSRELQPLLRFYGQKVSGTKSELVERIYEYELNEGIAANDVPAAKIIAIIPSLPFTAPPPNPSSIT